jgi:hypothetical protein
MARPVLEVMVVALVVPPPGDEAIRRHLPLERRRASLHLNAHEASDVHPLVVPGHDPVVGSEIVFGWRYSPAE